MIHLASVGPLSVAPHLVKGLPCDPQKDLAPLTMGVVFPNLSFDVGVLTYVNQLSQHSWTLDRVVVFLSNSHLLKGGVLIALVWWAWFRHDERRAREHLVATLLGCVLAVALARGLALTLPFRYRPLHQKGLELVVPHEMKVAVLDGWSAFPSDHAVLFFALATGLLFVSRKAGALALAYTTLFIGLPRVYLGLHYPTDILGGAALGIAVAVLAGTWLVRTEAVKSLAALSQARPQWFYPAFFLLTYEIADLFTGSRYITGLAQELLKAHRLV